MLEVLSHGASRSDAAKPFTSSETALSEGRLQRSKMFSLPAQLEAGGDSQPARVLLGKPTKPMRDEAVDTGR